MVTRPRRPGQSWATFLGNHAHGIAAADLFVVTIGFKLLYCLLFLAHGRRELTHYAVTAHPTAERVARQIVEAFRWDEAPRHLLRDRDAVYGEVVKRRLRGLGIRDPPIAPGSPWQNAYVERLIGSARRECFDHMIVFGETHLRRIMSMYAGLSLPETLYGWRVGANRVMLIPDGRHSHAAVVCARRLVSRAILPCSPDIAFSLVC